MTIEPGMTASPRYSGLAQYFPKCRNRLRVRAQAILLSIVPVVFLLSLLGIGLVIQHVTIEAGEWSARSEQNLAQSARLIATLMQANRAITSYASKHHDAALNRYDRSARSLRAEISQLVSLAMTPDQRVRAKRLGASLTQGLSVLDSFRQLQVSGNVARAKALAARPSTQALAMKIQRDAAAFDTAQRDLTLRHISDVRAIVWRYELALLVCCVLGILCSLYMTVMFGFSIARRVHRLERNVKRLGEGECTEPIEGTDEIASLDRAYHAVTRQVQRERAVAGTLQRALLPQHLPNIPGIRLETAYMPAAQQYEVGGDWYDVFELSPHVIGISIGDVGGHGVRAAAIMGAARQAIRTAAYIDSNPAHVVSRVNREACRGCDSTPVTALFATLDLMNGVFKYVAAGHPLPMIMTPTGDVETLDGHGLILGVDPDAEFETHEQQLQKGCRLLLYTDGVVENTRDYSHGVNALMQAFHEEARSMQNVARAIQERMLQGLPARDDAAILFIEIQELGHATPQR